MGLVYATIELINAEDLTSVRRGRIVEADVKRLKVKAMVDSGAVMLAINETVKTQLDLPVLEYRTARLADESLLKMEVVGPVEVRFENRRCLTEAFVLPGNAEVLLGAVPMELMDVLIHPAKNQLIVNPEHPNIPQLSMK
ncbi:MAG: clan AA aspartic protease [Sphingobacteriaceae bacterium]|nr:clan AA aspartic protease [Cytophagaceae bacterium]